MILGFDDTVGELVGFLPLTVGDPVGLGLGLIDIVGAPLGNLLGTTLIAGAPLGTLIGSTLMVGSTV